MSVQDVVKETGPKMEAVVEDFKRKLANVRTGRATVGLLDSVHVDYYGTMTRLIQMASVGVPEQQLKDKTISEDDERGGLDDVQKLTSSYTGKIDELAKNKETEIMSV